MSARNARRRTAARAASLALAGLLLAGQGGYIHAKAWLAQILIGNAWARTQAGESAARPWPWADSWPVARVEVPRLGVRQYVLSEASGSALAFGPGHLPATAAPGASGASLIAGHRDTHFRFLQNLQPGDEIRVETAEGTIVRYEVDATTVVDAHVATLRSEGTGRALALVTCYPFNTPVPGGPLRYVVTARQAR